MLIGIYTPYNRGEITAAALQIADLALTLGLDVNLISPTPIERGIHAYWDKHVVQARDKSVYYWATHCRYIVWFDPNEKHLQQARLVAKAPQTLIPMWHRLRKESSYQLTLYDRVVAPTRQICRQIDDQLFQNEAQEVACCPWYAGTIEVKRTGPVKPGTTRIYVPLDSQAIDEVGNFTLSCVDQTLENHPKVEFTLDFEKSWPRKVRQQLKSLQARWAGRLTMSYRTSLLEQPSQFHQHDWTFLPSIRSNLAMTALNSLCCGTPVIGYDVSPISEVIQDEKNGLLVECELGFNWLKAPIAGPTLAATLAKLTRIVTEDNLLAKLRRKNWDLDKRRIAFKEFWAKEWNVEL